MIELYKDTWENYVASWKVASVEEKKELFRISLDAECQYTDPLAKTKGWDELADYMINFHKQIPGGHFVTTYFLAHSNKSIARWEMRNGESAVLSDGISYGEYSDSGKLTAMTGFYETPS